jgi:hypothetical protein
MYEAGIGSTRLRELYYVLLRKDRVVSRLVWTSEHLGLEGLEPFRYSFLPRDRKQPVPLDVSKEADLIVQFQGMLVVLLRFG